MNGIYYHNFKTNNSDFLTTPPQDFRDYIPQDATCQNLYEVYLQMGKSPINAAGHVLCASVGETFVETEPAQ